MIKEINSNNQKRSVFEINRLQTWGLVFFICSLLGLIITSTIYFQGEGENKPPSFWGLLGWQLFGNWYSWLLFIPIILWLGKRFPFEKSVWKRSLPVHIVFFVVLLLCRSIWYVYAGFIFNPYHMDIKYQKFFSWVGNNISGQFVTGIFTYGMIVGISYAFNYQKRYRERELRASQLESQLTLAQLQVLKMQLQPHFLFNTINGIVGLVRDQKNKAAVGMLVGLSDLLRHTLQNSGKQEITLSEELDFLELYLDLEQMRFSDRLKIEMNIEPQTLKAIVPNLIMQPLVENSIRHGIDKRLEAGSIEITSWIEDGFLKIKICDDGPGLPENFQIETNSGIGLSNTRERLRQLYGAHYRLHLQNRAGGGTETLISFPLSLNGDRRL